MKRLSALAVAVMVISSVGCQCTTCSWQGMKERFTGASPAVSPATATSGVVQTQYLSGQSDGGVAPPSVLPSSVTPAALTGSGTR